MPNDLASFDKAVLEAIYHSKPYCFLGSGPAQDWNHSVGRGERFGINKSDERRVLFSSPYNASALSRACHGSCSILHDRDMEKALIRHAALHIQNAIRAGEYLHTENDFAFLKMVGLEEFALV